MLSHETGRARGRSEGRRATQASLPPLRLVQDGQVVGQQGLSPRWRHAPPGRIAGCHADRWGGRRRRSPGHEVARVGRMCPVTRTDPRGSAAMATALVLHQPRPPTPVYRSGTALKVIPRRRVRFGSAQSRRCPGPTDLRNPETPPARMHVLCSRKLRRLCVACDGKTAAHNPECPILRVPGCLPECVPGL